MPLRLIAAPADVRAFDAAFPELLQRATVDDWQVRLGATPDELTAVWTGIAGSRHVSLPDTDELAVAISERAIEVLEAVVFELARYRRVSAAGLHERTGVAFPEWRRLHGELVGLVAELDMGSAAPSVAPPVPVTPEAAAAGEATIERFRYGGVALADVRFSGIALDLGDAREIVVERGVFEDIACRGVRLIASRLSDVRVTGGLRDCAIVDCMLEDVELSGRLSSVRFVGGTFVNLDLRSALLEDCRFYEAVPGDGVFLPDGRDCFVVPVATVERAFAPLRPRIGAATYRALGEWAAAQEADYVSIVPSFWRAEMLPRRAHDDVEVETEVMDRLFRVRAASLASAGRPTVLEPEPRSE